MQNHVSNISRQLIAAIPNISTKSRNLLLWKVKQLLDPHQRRGWISDDPPGTKLSYKVPPIASPQQVLVSSVAIYAIAIAASCLAFDVLVSLENVMTMEAHQ